MPQNTKYKRFLAEKNISQRKVSIGTGIAYANLCMFANGYSDISTATLRKLCQFHNCSPNDILPFEKWLQPKVKKTNKPPTIKN